MGRYGFDDIFAARGLLGSLYSPDMEGVTPQQGLLAGFDYRDPYKNESAGNEVLVGANTDFTAPTQPTMQPWLAKSLANDQATSQPDKFYGFSGPTPADVEAAIGEPQTVQPQPIPRTFFEEPQPSLRERLNQYTDESLDAFRRASSNVLPGLGDSLRAGAQTLTGIGGDFGDFDSNLEREKIKSQLAEINSPIASKLGKGASALALGAITARAGVPNNRNFFKDVIFKNPTPSPTLPPRIPFRGPPKPRTRYDDL